ncbi:MAG: hypothetical protein [Bacteriophage sp.]|nr:MAG: hypothetical protein [Bacteriophage sp.]
MLGTIYGLAFEKSPIFLTGGIAELMGGVLPIIAISEGMSVLSNAITGNIEGITNGQGFLNFKPIAGGTVIQNVIATTPFYNQTTAANSLISEANVISLICMCPIGQSTHALMKTAKFSNLINALNYHNNNGGLYTVLTPSYIYRDCILLRVSDVNSTIDGSSQFQSVWRFDFIQSLVSNAKSKVVLNNFMNKATSGNLTKPTWESAAKIFSFPGLGQ